MYYHFPKGKEELALESVKLAGEMIIKNLINQLDMFESPIDGIVANFNDMAQIIQYFSWNMVFIILIPIPIIILIMILENVFLVNVGELTKPKIDYLSIILSSVGLGAIIFGISSVSAGDLKVSLISFIIGIILVAIFVSRQNKLKQPMLNLKPLKYPKFVIGVLLVMISMMVMFTMNVMLPMLLEESLGTTGFVAALALLPAVILNGAVTPVGGRIYDRYSVKWLVPIGILIMTVSVFVLANINIETSLGKIIVIYAVVCIGGWFYYVTISNAFFKSIT